MQNISLRAKIVSPIRFLIVAFICTLLFFVSAFPAIASTSEPSDGVVSLDEIQARTNAIAGSQPRSLEEIQADTEGGLNSIQGKADYHKMSRPENSQDATTVEDQIKDALESITPGKD